ncbi:Structural maintenance of chromosomes protein 2 Short=SMC protein 2; Short=SMC-2; AltName: Full=Chromosome assembly protein XCAP-E; AltName: Full=Chromosome-associated protein E [Serendipita indica DSM 11827]|nr:Structural maintenance of chromosomes protein 2 Short=SMC protein 2; Short=SMC-2; AltName: Full=Chromosome assembly protein XCAP-E; AltName: Full=Chromosome-associated protein E [Serendipita indica DSM 11827]
MYLEELILEGFKSYPVRTSITGWDPSFSAVTGLNGSGKSNILDAICFVLGLTNLSQVRATNQQDLIYKRGQAGITRASVTAVFNNSDRSKSPVGLEQCSQITVTRQIALPNVSKYLLNGHKSTQQAVQLLFQGVQLNINNPNFLIMQGRITKVLNMRPPEILGLIEEAAGTRMYEERKDKAKKTMTKKEKRVQEITSLLDEEITPKLDKLRDEKRSFLAYQKRSTEIERLTRLLMAWEWNESTERVKRKDAEVQKRTEQLAAQKSKLQAEKKAAIKRRDKEIAKGGQFQKLEAQVAEFEKKIVSLDTQVELKQASIRDEESRAANLKEAALELETGLAAKIEEVEEVNNKYNMMKTQHDTFQQKYQSNQELLQSLQTGLSDGANSSGGGYLGQLAETKARIVQAETEEEQIRRQAALVERELADAQGRWKKVEKEASDGAKTIEKGKQDVEKLKRSLAGMNWSDEKETNLASSLKKARDALKGLTEASHSNYSKSTALEIAAGGRLYNVVVEDERVGEQILQKGNLKKRVTLIPLNKIRAFTASAQKLAAATRVGKGKAQLALQLIGYEEEVSNAMAYVFGDVLICDDADTAKAVTFHPEINMRSVTINGDVYDPSGTISGGSAPQSSGLLLKVQELHEVERELHQAKVAYQKLEHEEQKADSLRQSWTKAKRELEIKSHEVNLLEQQVGGSNASRIGNDIKELEKKLAQLREASTTAQARQKEAEQECKKLEKDMKEFHSNKDGKLKQLKAEVAKQKTELHTLTVRLKEQQRLAQTSQMELEQMRSDIEAAHASVIEAKEATAIHCSELEKLTKALGVAKESHEEASSRLQAELAALTRFDQEIKGLDAAISNIKDAITEMEVTIKKTEHEIQTAQKERASSEAHVASLEKHHPWIKDEKRQFGKPGTMYDYGSVDIAQTKDKAKELEELQKGMKKKINPKVLNMIDTVEKKESELKKNLQIVLGDKKKIEETIDQLDVLKLEALESTWTKVSKDFGEIFGDLLPGNNAKLQYAEPGNIAAGLEVKVQLGSIWKQSLTELSGGQRSLIALSLIMSLLQFKPAPMYILDEVDAALDLSHTQHIGELFKNRFKGSQFIVVSLKDGLFNNANVLFRTKFRDGTSIVERTTQRSGTVTMNGRSGR